MVVETSYVRSWNQDWPWKPSFPPGEGAFDPAPSAAVKRQRASSPKHQKTGWDSESDAERSASSDAKAVLKGRATHLADLIEGFFDYYLGFPLEEKAVSIWAGHPLQRKTGYLPLAADDDGHVLPQLPKVTREEREELYEEEGEEEDEELFVLAQQGINAEQMGVVEIASRQPDTQAVPEDAVGGTETTDDEAETVAHLAKIDAMLRAHGVEQLAPSFEDKHKQEKTARAIAEQAAAAQEASESSFPELTPTATRFSKMSLNTKRTSSSSNSINGKGRPSSSAGGLLELHHANDEDHLFPFPEQEDPSRFIEPPHWTQRLVVQDPFIHTRNTCMNIIPPVVHRIIREMQRAHDLLRQSAPLEQICLNVSKDAEYSSDVARLAGGVNPSRAARRLQKQQAEKSKRIRDEERAQRREERRAAFAERVAAGLEPRKAAYADKQPPTAETAEQRKIAREESSKRRQEKWQAKKLARRAADKAKKAANRATQAGQPGTTQAPMGMGPPRRNSET